MPDLANRGPMGPKDDHKCDGECDRHKAAVKGLCICVACLRRGPVDPHHVQHGRYSQSRPCHKKTIPLCRQCHDAFHAGKVTWADKYGLDYDLLPIVEEWLENGAP